MKQKWSLIYIIQYRPLRDENGIITKHNYSFRFRSLYERCIIYNKLSNNIDVVKFFPGIYGIGNKSKKFNQKKGRRYYTLPRRNRLFLTAIQGKAFNYTIDFFVEPDYLDSLTRELISIFKETKFIPGYLSRERHTKSKYQRFCFKAITFNNFKL